MWEYRHGCSVDVENSAILDDTGVQSVQFPRLNFVAERIGNAAIISGERMIRGLRFGISSGQETRDLPANHKRARQIGTICMTACLLATAPLLADSADSILESGVRATEEAIDNYIAEPLSSLSRLSISAQ